MEAPPMTTEDTQALADFAKRILRDVEYVALRTDHHPGGVPNYLQLVIDGHLDLTAAEVGLIQRVWND
jgi:hypothetical protein